MNIQPPTPEDSDLQLANLVSVLGDIPPSVEWSEMGICNLLLAAVTVTAAVMGADYDPAEFAGIAQEVEHTLKKRLGAQ
jgi:hypothetical protein